MAFILLAWASAAQAVEGARWLLAPEGVRSAGLAGAFGAVHGSPEALWYNPAGLAGIAGVEANFTRTSFPGAWDSDHLLLGLPWKWRHHLGLLYHRNGATDVLRDARGNEGGNFEVSQSLLGAGYAYHASRWSAGALAKQATEVVERKTASGLLYDLGVQGDLVKDRVLLGLSLQDLGSAPDLGGPSIEAPALLRAGAGLAYAGEVSTLALYADYRYRLVSHRSGVSLGLEYSERYLEGRLGLRAGWDFSQADLGGAAGLALGAGFGYGPVGLDYAWAPREALGSQHRVALTLLWDLRARQRERDMAGYLGVSETADAESAPAAAPTPLPTPTREAGFRESNVGSRLDQLLAATPTPLPTPLPAVEEKRSGKGILGFFSGLFGGKKAEEEGAKPEPGGILHGVFRFLGIGADAPTQAPDTPEQGHEDSFNQATPGPTPAPTPTALPMQRLKGDSVALPEPTPQPTPVVEKVKSWMKF